MLDLIAEAPDVARKRIENRKPDAEPRVVGFNMKTSPEWAEWAREAAEHCGMSMATLIDQALRRYVKAQGFEKPAPKR
jgi:predicted HicB family RNase H-like nuclease